MENRLTPTRKRPTASGKYRGGAGFIKRNLRPPTYKRHGIGVVTHYLSQYARILHPNSRGNRLSAQIHSSRESAAGPTIGHSDGSSKLDGRSLASPLRSARRRRLHSIRSGVLFLAQKPTPQYARPFLTAIGKATGTGTAAAKWLSELTAKNRLDVLEALLQRLDFFRHA
jgi:hypothetical protein